MAVLFRLERFVVESESFVVRFVRLSLGVEVEEEAAKRGAVEVPLTVMSASIGIHLVLSASRRKGNEHTARKRRKRD